MIHFNMNNDLVINECRNYIPVLHKRKIIQVLKTSILNWSKIINYEKFLREKQIVYGRWAKDK